MIKKIVILGGGTAGWMTAAALSRYLKNRPIQVVLVESEDIGTVGVGEATLPHIRHFNDFLGIQEKDFLTRVNATFKLGINFRNWGCIGETYIHPFGSHGYRIANDASLYAAYLREYSECGGIERINGKVQSVTQMNDGTIKSLLLETGEVVEGDLFIDCSGFRSLLLGQTLKTKFEDWSHWLPCDRAIAIPCATSLAAEPYTTATAYAYGWQWRIPLRNRVGNGIVFSSRCTDQEDAEKHLMANLEGKPIAEPNYLKFKAGRYVQGWVKNTLAIGLASGFLEPLESTSIYLIQLGIMKLLEHLPVSAQMEVNAVNYNRHMELEYTRIRDFLILHYCITNRNDSEFWRYCKNMGLPADLVRKINLYKETARIEKYEQGLFMQPSWLAVLIGQGAKTGNYDSRIENQSLTEISGHLNRIRSQLNAITDNMRSADYYLHCKSGGGDLKSIAGSRFSLYGNH